MFSKKDAVQKTELAFLTGIFPKELLVIILEYRHDYLYQILAFCKEYGLKECLEFLKVKHSGPSLSEISKSISSKMEETKKFLRFSAEEIEKHKIQLREFMQIELKAETIKYEQAIQPRIDTLNREIASLNQSKNKKIAEAEQAAMQALERKLELAEESGEIAEKKAREKQALIELREFRKTLTQSELFFEEIQRMTFLLEEFPKDIQKEIDKKGKWSNRFRRVTKDDVDKMLGPTHTRLGRIMLGLGVWFLVTLSVALLSMLVFLVASLFLEHPSGRAEFRVWHAQVFLPAFLLSLIIGASLGAIIGILVVINLFFLRVDLGNQERFQKHTLASVVSKDSLEQFNEIKSKIEAFQSVKDKIDDSKEDEAPHPFLELNHKSTVEQVVSAAKAEMAFFKHFENYKKSEDLGEEQGTILSLG